MFEHLLDPHLHLRMLQEPDADELFTLVDRNRQHLRQWLPWVDTSKEVLAQRQFIRSTLDQYDRNQGFVCSIRASGRIIGVVGYHPIRWANRSVEIGYWLCREAVGKGIMTRSCRVLVEHAFGQLGLNRVAIPAAVGNLRSRAIPERLGFQFEGIRRDAEWLYDHFVDHAVYAGLAREWDSQEGRCV